MTACVKCDGKVMREHGDIIYLPYGNEYSLLLKNLSTQRALVNVEIDGVDVVPSGLIVRNGQTIDLERFVINGDMSKGPKFKFIEKTDKISDFRGDKLEDGIVRISYRYEVPPTLGINLYVKSWNPSLYDGANTVYGSSSIRSLNSYMNNISVGSQVSSKSENGITTYGAESSQKFTYGNIGKLEVEEHVIIFHLKGDIGQAKVSQPLTVNTKIKCGVCGTSNSSRCKFCGECGTNLSY